MAELDKLLTVQVFVPTLRSDGRDGGGDAGEVATGFPVAQDLILVARHVLEPANRDARYPIAVLWHNVPGAAWIDLDPAAIVWRGQGEIDAALLRCPRPVEARGWAILSEERPRDHTQWVSQAFPRAGKYDDTRNPTSFRGHVHSMAPTAWHFEIDAASPPTTEEGWRGASGMPVFVHGRMLGVVKQVAPNLRGARLHVTPCWRMLEDAEFRQAIGFDAQRDRRQRAERQLLASLKKSPKAIEALEAAHDRFSDLGSVDRARVAAQRILEAPINEFLDALEKAYRWVRDEEEIEESADLAAAREILSAVSQLVTPALFDHGVVAWARSQRDQMTGALVALPACLRTVAEIIMAAVDGKPTRFGDRTDHRAFPTGAFSVPIWPETGLDGVDGAVEALSQHVNAKYEPGWAARFEKTVHDYIVPEFYQPEPGTVRTAEEQRRLAATEMALRSREEGRTYYMLFHMPREPQARNELEQLVARLKQIYSALMFLTLDDDVDLEDYERNRYGLFRSVLRKKG